jgi:hypothetical protein
MVGAADVPKEQPPSQIWLGEKPADTPALMAACAPFPAEDVRGYPISTRVREMCYFLLAGVVFGACG